MPMSESGGTKRALPDNVALLTDDFRVGMKRVEGCRSAKDVDKGPDNIREESEPGLQTKHHDL